MQQRGLFDNPLEEAAAAGPYGRAAAPSYPPPAPAPPGELEAEELAAQLHERERALGPTEEEEEPPPAPPAEPEPELCPTCGESAAAYRGQVAGPALRGTRGCTDLFHAEPELPPPTAPAWELYGTDLFGQPIKPPERGKMATTFLVPPFSVLNAREGFWQDRKRAWVAAGIRAVEGRSEVLLAGHQNTAEQAAELAERYGMDEEKLATGGGVYTEASSIFDPVLCELAYKWFCPPGGHVLDPFAGESTKGIVAAMLGYGYTGCELRPEQVEANRAQAASIGCAPTWVCGDSSRIGELLPPGEQYDFCWTSPPYYDLEVYSSDKKDGSAFATYELFMDWYALIFSACIARLKRNRFLAVKVGEIRDERGVYRNFVGDNIRCFRGMGLHYYDEIILVTSAGSLPLRAGKHFKVSRKVGKCHQNVLVFWKGEPREINPTVRQWEVQA